MSSLPDLKQRLADHSARITIVGLGYVGLPLSIRFAEAGFRVLGLDSDPDKPRLLKSGESYLRHIPHARITEMLEAGFEASSDYSRAAQADVLILCVPTPLDDQREPDLSFVINTVDSLLPYLRPGQAVALESTTYPGTTEEELRPRIEAAGLKIGEDIALIYSPEREDPGNQDFSTRTIPKVVGGSTPACLEVGEALYSEVIDQVVPVSSTRVAEMTKLLENIHRAVNIGLVNEMKVVADRMGINIYEVIDAAATKPFGFVPYYPGPGLGGHCIPIDPFYLTWKAKQYGVDTRFIELAGEVNSAMPAYVVEKVSEALASQGKELPGSKVLVLGIAYKKNVDDMRESPSAEILQQLQTAQASIDYCDPLVPHFPKMRHYQFELDSVPFDAATLGEYDCVVISTNHDLFDYELLRKSARTIVDARGVFKNGGENIYPA
jgi:UDP-N-acetyl-D-glucosamine dehydrogenase